MLNKKGNINKRALKVFILFAVILFAMNFLMTYIIATRAEKAEVEKIKTELENTKYELEVAKKENDELKLKLDIAGNTNVVNFEEAYVNAKEIEKKTVKTVATNNKTEAPTKTRKEVKPVKSYNKAKVEKNTNTKTKNTFDFTPLGDIYHIEFKPMYYKDVEYDIIRGKIKIPEQKSPYKEEIEEKVQEVKLMEDKYARYDIIIARARSYGRDVSYLDYDFLDELFATAKEYNVNPYVMLAIIDGESNYYPTAKNKYSSATGLGQIVKGTGKYVHTNILGYKTEYNHSDLLDARTNIKYMAGYFKYLKRHSSYDKAMGEYCGSKTYYANTYRGKLVKNMVALGLTKAEANSILKGKITYNVG